MKCSFTSLRPMGSASPGPSGGPPKTPGRAARRERKAEPRKAEPSKLLLSCRTHYFRSIRDETTHFTGQHRDGPVAREYLALLMLPFNEAQIREYLHQNVPDAKVDELFELISSVHNLREIAERPLTLRMITDQLGMIERAKLAGRTVRAVDLYASFVEQWLSRDNGKHSLLPDHKQLLMENLAAQLWRAGLRSWAVRDVEQWLLEFLHSRPELILHYSARTPDLWKEDLRTATFLVRKDDDTFGFAHTSLHEYFLSCYLLRALLSGGTERAPLNRAPLNRALPSWSGAGGWRSPAGRPWCSSASNWPGSASRINAGAGGRSAALASAGPAAGETTVSEAAVLAFAYGTTAEAERLPHHRLAGSRLDGADLRRRLLDGRPSPDGRPGTSNRARPLGASICGAAAWREPT